MPTIYALAEQQKKDLLARDDATLKKMVAEYKKLWNSTSAQLSDLEAQMKELTDQGLEVPASWIHQEGRLRKFMAQFESGITEFNKTALDVISGQRQTEAETSAKDQAALLDHSLPGFSFNKLNKEAVASMVAFLDEQSPLQKSLAGFGVEAAVQVQDALVQGIALGHGAAKIRRRIQEAAGGHLTKAMRVARTEPMRAHYEAAHRVRERNADVLDGWVWYATLKTTTCPSCWAMHGTWHKIEERMSEHPVGRCTTIPAVKGVDPGITTGAEEFEKLSEDDKRKVLGNLYDHYKDKALTLHDLVNVRESDEWDTSRSRKSLKQLVDEGIIEPKPLPQVQQDNIETGMAFGAVSSSLTQQLQALRAKLDLAEHEMNSLKELGDKAEYEKAAKKFRKYRREVAAKEKEIADLGGGDKVDPIPPPPPVIKDSPEVIKLKEKLRVVEGKRDELEKQVADLRAQGRNEEASKLAKKYRVQRREAEALAEEIKKKGGNPEPTPLPPPKDTKKEASSKTAYELQRLIEEKLVEKARLLNEHNKIINNYDQYVRIFGEEETKKKVSEAFQKAKLLDDEIKEHRADLRKVTKTEPPPSEVPATKKRTGKEVREEIERLSTDPKTIVPELKKVIDRKRKEAEDAMAAGDYRLAKIREGQAGDYNKLVRKIEEGKPLESWEKVRALDALRPLIKKVIMPERSARSVFEDPPMDRGGKRKTIEKARQGWNDLMDLLGEADAHRLFGRDHLSSQLPSLPNTGKYYGPSMIEIRGRANFSKRGYAINLSDSDGPEVATHEYGHWLEMYGKGVMKKSGLFWLSRTKGENFQLLSKLTGMPSYGGETAKKDKFMHPYMGKVYAVPGEDINNLGLVPPEAIPAILFASELVSMGVEHLAKDPLGLMHADPEYFDFIWDVLHGE